MAGKNLIELSLGILVRLIWQIIMIMSYVVPHPNMKNWSLN